MVTSESDVDVDTASVGQGDDDDFPSATGKLLSTSSGGSQKKSSSSSAKSKTSTSDKHKKKSSKRDTTDEDKKKKSHKKDEDRKQKPKKTDEDADDLLASFGKALIAPAPKSKSFDPLGVKKFDPLGAGGGASKKFDPLGSASALSGGSSSAFGLLGPVLVTTTSAQSDATKSSATSGWASAPNTGAKEPDKDKDKYDAPKTFNVLDAAKLIQSSGTQFTT